MPMQWLLYTAAAADAAAFTERVGRIRHLAPPLEKQYVYTVLFVLYRTDVAIVTGVPCIPAEFRTSAIGGV